MLESTQNGTCILQMPKLEAWTQSNNTHVHNCVCVMYVWAVHFHVPAHTHARACTHMHMEVERINSFIQSSSTYILELTTKSIIIILHAL